MELAPGESGVALDLLAERLLLVRRLLSGHVPSIIVAPIPALMQGVPDGASLPTMLRVIRAGDRVDQAELSRWLSEAGYSRVETIDSPGEFAIRGGIIDISRREAPDARRPPRRLGGYSTDLIARKAKDTVNRCVRRGHLVEPADSVAVCRF